MLKKKFKSTALAEQRYVEKFLDGDGNCQLKSLPCLLEFTILQKEKLAFFSSECVTTHNLGKISIILGVKVAIIAKQFPVSSK